MASNSTQLGCANTSYKYTLSVSWSESETNIANNTTKISANGSLSASNVGFDAMYDSYACHLKLYWHDNNKNTDTLFATSGAFTTCGMGYGTRSVSGSITVTHKSDGSLSGYVKVYFEAPTTSGGWSPSSSSCSTGWTTCTTIARASSISGLSGNQLNSGVSVTIDRKSSSFTHKVEYKFVNSGWTTVSSNAATSCSFTPPLSLASQIPSAVSGALTVRVTTYNGSTQIGSSVTNSINLSVPSTVVPSLSGLSATRIDNDVPSSWGIYVKGISQVKITASGASGSYGSTITGYSISGPGLYTNSSSGTSGQLSSTGTQTYTCTVTDSRGRTASKSVSITVVDYSYPNISMSAERCKSDGTKDTSGTYLRVIINYGIASVSDKNSIASKSCSCNGVSNSSFASGTAFVLAANCSIGSHYAVNASIRDALGRTASASAEVSTAYRVLNVRANKSGIAFGKFAESDNMFDVGYNATIRGHLHANSDLYVGGLFGTKYHFSGGGSSAAYMRIATLKVTGGYVNGPIEIRYYQRGSVAATSLYVRFQSTNSTDPSVDVFNYEGWCRGAYIAKTATSTWDIFIAKSEPWEDIGIQYWAHYDFGVGITYRGENYTSLPSGYITATPIYYDNVKATNGYLYSTANGHTVKIGSQNNDWCHYETDAPKHWFNRDVYVRGNVYGGSDYDRRLAYLYEVLPLSGGTVTGNITMASKKKVIGGQHGWGCTEGNGITGFVNGTTYMEIRSTNGAKGITWWDSDSSLKNNIKNTEVRYALEKISQLKHIEFDWKENNSHVDLGYVADDVEKILPCLVYDVAQYDEDGKPNGKAIKNIDYRTMIPLITMGIQELIEERNLLWAFNEEAANCIIQLREEIDDLKSTVNELKAEIESLKKAISA